MSRQQKGVKPVQTRICLVGATGLIGSALIEQALHRPRLRIIGVARREAKLPFGARMEMLIADRSGWPDAIAASRAQVLVCALGTTMRKVGKDETAFRAVDHDLVLEAAHAAREAGIGHMILVSSAGADRASRHFYLRVKGETEQALGRMRFRRLDILRPGILRGPRQESRPLERLGQLLAPLADPFLAGQWRQYRSMPAEKLAQAIFALAQEKAGGQFVHDYDSMRRAIHRAGD